MTPAQWAAYGGCPTCEATPARPCTTRRWAMGDDLDAPHPARPLRQTPDEVARLLDDLVTVRVNEGVTVHPGDTLVIRIDPERLFPDQLEEFNGELEQVRAYVEAMLPRGARCVVVAAAGSLGVVRHGETSAPATDAGPVRGSDGTVGATGIGVLRDDPQGAAPGVARDVSPDQGDAVPGGAA